MDVLASTMRGPKHPVRSDILLVRHGEIVLAPDLAEDGIIDSVAPL